MHLTLLQRAHCTEDFHTSLPDVMTLRSPKSGTDMAMLG